MASTPEMVNSVNMHILADRIDIIEDINNWEFLRVQHTKLCMITLPLLKSVVSGFQQDNAIHHTATRIVETVIQFD